MDFSSVRPYVCFVPREASKIVFTFRIDPGVKDAAKKAAKAAKVSVSRYIQELIRLDLWRKGLLG